MPNNFSNFKKMLTKKAFIILFIPLPFVMLACFHLSNIKLNHQLNTLAQSYVPQLEEVVDELRDENKQALYGAQNCQQIQKDLLFKAFLREMLISENGKIVCSSKRGYKEYESFASLFPNKNLQTGEYLFDFPYENSRVRSLIVVDADKNNPRRAAISVVDQRYIDVRLGLKSDDRIQNSQLTVNKVTYPKGNHVEDLPYAVSASSNYLAIKVTIAPSDTFKHDIFAIYYISIIPVSLLISLIIFLIQHWFNNRGSLIEDLKRGMKNNELYLHYQPLIASDNKQLSGVEALIRWKKPAYGNIPPDIFIPLAEQHNFINIITDFVFDKALLEWKDSNLSQPMHIGINVPPSYLLTSDCMSKLSRWVKQYQAHNLTLGIEITERQLLNQQGRAILNDIRALGIEVFIDDFGTGYTSLSILQDIKFDYLKIDRCFINTIGVESVNAPVLNSIINLAHQLNVKIVAEGVETQEQMEYLTSKNVSLLQGYFLYKPMPFSQISNLLIKGSLD
ncbi:EAL domain-containing protein [Vibrio algicola]|uniref:EAL domain-containing protein n=1 Tax=Vibrio algicola TaxID=2662262 RepID=A0A5Q0TH95_9VIBR|nr:EAL domain-containing protein [Vibrio algicola]